MIKNTALLILILQLNTCALITKRNSQADYALWSQTIPHTDWTRHVEKAVINSNLLKTKPNDMDQFCPNYNSSKQTKIKFWVGLLSAMVKYESQFNSTVKYQEKFKDNQGHFILSRGLLQISIESAKSRYYDCQINDSLDLHDPKINLSCGLKILSYWVIKDNLIAHSQNKNTGASRYWSVLRPTHGKLAKIQTATNRFSFCQMPTMTP